MLTIENGHIYKRSFKILPKHSIYILNIKIYQIYLSPTEENIEGAIEVSPPPHRLMKSMV